MANPVASSIFVDGNSQGSSFQGQTSPSIGAPKVINSNSMDPKNPPSAPIAAVKIPNTQESSEENKELQKTKEVFSSHTAQK